MIKNFYNTKILFVVIYIFLSICNFKIFPNLTSKIMAMEIKVENQVVKNKPKKDLKKIKIFNQKEKQNYKLSNNKISITIASINSKINILEKRFLDNHNPQLGILIAQQYYKNKRYKKAYFYAFKVNSIDQTVQESWLLAAKSLFFLRKRDIALKLLNDYIQGSNSIEAIKLYKKIRQNKFK